MKCIESLHEVKGDKVAFLFKCKVYAFCYLSTLLKTV